MMGDTIHITYRHGWALVEDVETGRTALCIPRYVEGPPQSLNFEVVNWHETYEDARYIISVMQASNVTIDDYVAGQQQPDPPPADDPTLIERAAVEPEPVEEVIVEGPKRKRRR